MARWTIIRVSKQIHKKVPLITQSDTQKTFFILPQGLGKELLVAKLNLWFEQKLRVKGVDRIIVQSLNGS